MFTVKRTTTSLNSHYDVSTNKYEFEELSDALSCLDKLKKEDNARFVVLQADKPNLFYDSYSDAVSYHFTVGKCLIMCEIEGILENACDVFFIQCQ